MTIGIRVNDIVRKRLRRLRLAKNIRITQINRQAGIPCSSYSDMEAGVYKINLDNLFRILGVLEADINDVWPGETLDEERFYIRKIQEFRLSEIISLCDADGAALFALEEGRCRALMDRNLPDSLVERLALYIEDGIPYRQGLWFKRDDRDTCLRLFIKAGACPEFVKSLVSNYMIYWSTLHEEAPEVFLGPLKGRRSRPDGF